MSTPSPTIESSTAMHLLVTLPVTAEAFKESPESGVVEFGDRKGPATVRFFGKLVYLRETLERALAAVEAAEIAGVGNVAVGAAGEAS